MAQHVRREADRQAGAPRSVPRAVHAGGVRTRMRLSLRPLGLGHRQCIVMYPSTQPNHARKRWRWFPDGSSGRSPAGRRGATVTGYRPSRRVSLTPPARPADAGNPAAGAIRVAAPVRSRGRKGNVTEEKTPMTPDSWSLFLMLRMRPPLPRPGRRSNAMSTPPTPPRSGASTPSPSDRGGGKGFRNAQPHRPDDLMRPPSPFPHFSPPSCQRWDPARECPPRRGAFPTARQHAPGGVDGKDGKG